MSVKNERIVLHNENIDETIRLYEKKVTQIKHQIEGVSVYHFLLKIKREPIGLGPYPHVSLFESANRIMSDLVLLYGTKVLLRDRCVNNINLPFKEYSIILGHGHGDDLHARTNNYEIIGEAFNVAKTYFPVKVRNELQNMEKRRVTTKPNELMKIILFNKEATPNSEKLYLSSNHNLLYLPIDLHEILNIENLKST